MRWEQAGVTKLNSPTIPTDSVEAVSCFGTENVDFSNIRASQNITTRRRRQRGNGREDAVSIDSGLKRLENELECLISEDESNSLQKSGCDIVMGDDCENISQIGPLTVRDRKEDINNLSLVRCVEEDSRTLLECGMPPEEEIVCWSRHAATHT